MLSQKEISNAEVIQEVYKLIKENNHLNAFVTLNEDNSIKKAEALDNKPSNLPLAGIPIAQKDLFCTKGLRTTCGSKILDNFVPPYSATVIKNLENAGSKFLVLECIGLNASKQITNELNIPTIGIGASKYCDGQVLVIDDILNLNSKNKKPKFVKKYTNIEKIILEAVKNFSKEVKNKKFPSKKYSY